VVYSIILSTACTEAADEPIFHADLHFLPVYDGGVDFILHREAKAGQPETTTDTRKVQLKGRWTID